MSLPSLYEKDLAKGKGPCIVQEQCIHRQEGRNMKGMLNQMKGLLLALRFVGVYWSLSVDDHN